MPKQMTSHSTPIGPRWAIGEVGYIARNGSAGLGDESVRTGLDRFMGGYNSTLATLQDHLVVDRIREDWFGPVVRVVAKGAFMSAQAEARAAQVADTSLRDPVLKIGTELARDTWQTLRAADSAGQARWINQADLTDLTATVAFGNRVPLDDTLWEAALDRFLVENVVQRDGIAAHFPARTTFADPLPVGPDMGAVRKEGEKRLAAHRARLEAVDANRASARELVNFLAVAFELSQAEILDAIVGRDRKEAA